MYQFPIAAGVLEPALFELINVLHIGLQNALFLVEELLELIDEP